MKSPYMKPIAKTHIKTYVKYIATRDGVENADSTQKFYKSIADQRKIIEKLISDYPDSKDLFEYEDYINNPNPLNILIIICDKLDERKKINKLLKEKCTVIESNLSIEDKIKKELEDYKMDFKTINYLIGYLNNDNQRIITELRKLKMYKYDEKVITIPDIDEIVLKEFDDNVFSLIDSIVKKNIKKSFEIYEELTSRGEDINKIVIMTTDQFRLIYKVKLLINEGKSKDMITSILKIHPYRVKLAMEASYNFTNMELIRYIKTLGQIDINTKMGVSPNNYGFDLFLLNL